MSLIASRRILYINFVVFIMLLKKGVTPGPAEGKSAIIVMLLDYTYRGD